MIALELESPAPIEHHPLKAVERSRPVPGPGQVLLEVRACGVCHTDLHIVEGEIRPPSYPVIPGHQVVGVVKEIGEGETDRERMAPKAPGEGERLTEISIGQRVGVPWLYSADGTCPACRTGEENLCPNIRFTGFHVPGGYAETMLAEARFCLPLPEQMDDIQAAPLLCAGIVGYRSLKKADVQPGEHLGLFGFGASGHLVLQVARYWGCPVSVFTRSAHHRQHALDLGASWAGRAEQSPPAALDRAIIFAPAGELVPLALEKLRPGGTLALNAIYMSPIPGMPYATLYGERTIRSVANATYTDGIEFLDIAAKIPLKPTVVPYPFMQANQALDDLKHSRFSGEAVLQIHPSPA